MRISGFLFLLIMLPAAQGFQDGSINTSGIIVELIAYLLGICGSFYLGSILWTRGEKGLESWKYLSISMVLFGFWNIIMALDLVVAALIAEGQDSSGKYLNNILFALRNIDPIVGMIAFVLLFTGLKKIIKAMHDKPWTVFQRVDFDD
jgi:hypothetical protein